VENGVKEAARGELDDEGRRVEDEVSSTAVETTMA
jgi:hypothetical protein